MSGELHAAIHALQSGDESRTLQAFAAIAEMARREPAECAAELSRAVLAEQADGALRTPRILTLLGLTRVPMPECLPICLDLLRGLVATETPPPADAVIGAAAIVARTQPRELLPDVATLEGDPQAAKAIDHVIVQSLMFLLSITSKFLRELPDNAVTDMARWLWCDCAALDLMTMADFAGLHVEKSGADDPIVGLIVDLVERLPAHADQKRYASQRLQQANVAATVVEQLQTAWRAIRVAPPDPASAGAPPIADPEPPPPEPRIDELLVAFSEGDDVGVELARVAIDEMFEQTPPPVALPCWLAITVDALPPRRRRTDIEWALGQVSATLRRPGERVSMVPPSVLQRWLDTPQLLNPRGTQIALDLLGRQQPGLVLQHYLHRAVAASSERHAEMLMGGMWRELAAAEPSAVLAVASRWIAFGFGQSAFLEMLLDVVIERVSAQPTLIDELANALEPTPDTPADAIDIARKLLDELRSPSPEDQQP